MKDDVMGAFSDVSEEMLQGRDDLKETSMLSPVMNQEGMISINSVIDEVKRLEGVSGTIVTGQASGVIGEGVGAGETD
jgi:hypothetical protein